MAGLEPPAGPSSKAARQRSAEALDALHGEVEREKLIHNEKTKATSTAVNLTAVGLFGGGAMLPIVGLSYPLATAPPDGQTTLITALVWALIAIGLHWKARTILEDLR